MEESLFTKLFEEYNVEKVIYGHLHGKESFKSARAYADENFIYRVGETIVAEDFNENRWKESTTGIHFFLTREEAIGYL